MNIGRLFTLESGVHISNETTIENLTLILNPVFVLNLYILGLHDEDHHCHHYHDHVHHDHHAHHVCKYISDPLELSPAQSGFLHPPCHHPPSLHVLFRKVMFCKKVI